MEHPDYQKGIGLQSIRNRARAIEGDLSISSKPGGGTIIRLISYIPKKIHETIH